MPPLLATLLLAMVLLSAFLGPVVIVVVVFLLDLAPKNGIKGRLQVSREDIARLG